jgi:1-deoxy-D-xylulose-5-phosphate reductoisomerase
MSGTVREVSIVGSTGSIGTQTLDVISATAGEFAVAALGANTSSALLLEQAIAYRPRVVAIGDATLAHELEAGLPSGTELRAGTGALESLGEEGDIVVNGVVGFAGLPVTLAALRSGRRLALANKESLIAAAPVVQAARATPGAEIVPVDSEHCAIHQCLGPTRHVDASMVLPGEGPLPPGDVSRLVLTASGGPFRGRTRDELADVRITDALAHPTWQMGPKITIDSSTLMNKGLEVLEAHELFGLDFDAIDVVVHPQSIVHSMVEFTDGATIAQLSLPDMRLPVIYALAYPDRASVAFGRIDWAHLERLDFSEPDTTTFSCLALAYAAGRVGGSAPAWLNAANEVAVAAFLSEELGWLEIADVVEATLAAHEPTKLADVADVLAADAAARRFARGAVEARTRAR